MDPVKGAFEAHCGIPLVFAALALGHPGAEAIASRRGSKNRLVRNRRSPHSGRGRRRVGRGALHRGGDLSCDGMGVLGASQEPVALVTAA